MEIEAQICFLRQQLASKDRHIHYIEGELMKLDRNYGILEKAHAAEKQANLEYKSKCLRKIQEEVHMYREKYELLYENYAEQILRKSQLEEQVREERRQNHQLGSRLIEKRSENKQLKQKCKNFERVLKSIKTQNQQFWNKIIQIQKQGTQLQAQNSHLKQLLLDQAEQIQKQFTQINNLNNPESSILQQNSLSHTITNPQYSPYFDTIKNNQNPWKEDFKKLKNCIDYGHQYICGAFDSSHLDSLTSRQVFSFIRKTVLLLQETQQQNRRIRAQKEEQLSEMKFKIQELIREMKYLQKDKKGYTLDVGVQTEEKVRVEVQQNLKSSIQMNCRLKYKIHSCLELVNRLVLYAAGIHQMLQTARSKNNYYKLIQKSFFQTHKNSNKDSARRKFRKCLFSIFFIKCLEKKASPSFYKPEIQHTYAIQRLITNEKKGIVNVQLERIKQMKGGELIAEEFQYRIIEDSVEYCLHKLEKSERINQLGVGRSLQKYIRSFVIG